MKDVRLATVLLVAGCCGVFMRAGEVAVGRGLEERLTQLDRDGDGKLSVEEMGNAQSHRRLDRNGGAFVKLEEAREAIRAIRAARETIRLAPLAGPVPPVLTWQLRPCDAPAASTQPSASSGRPARPCGAGTLWRWPEGRAVGRRAA